MIWAFLKSYLSALVSLLTGGVLLAAVFGYEAWTHKNVPPWINTAILCLSFVVALIMVFRKLWNENQGLRRQLGEEGQNLEHDKNIFRRGDELYPEPVVREALSNIVGYSSRERDENRSADRLLHWCENIESHFLDQELNDSRSSFLTALQRLNEKTAVHFFGNGGDTARLYPELKSRMYDGDEIAGQRYNKAKDEVVTAARNAELAYNVYREQVKRKLRL